MVDVGFGGDGATKPLPMIPGLIHTNLGLQENRLIYETIPELVDQTRPVWIYQYRNGIDKPWNSLYHFPEVEFLHGDFEMMNYFTSTNLGELNFQTKMVLVIKFLRGKREGEEEGDEEIVGKKMLVDGDAKVNMGGKTQLVKTCKSEEDRVEVLREIFGIHLTEDEVRGIRGRNVELLGGMIGQKTFGKE